MSSYRDPLTANESITFILTNVGTIFVGVYLWYKIWIKKYGIEIPMEQINSEKTVSYLSSKNFKIIIKDLYNKLRIFNKDYIIHAVGYEGYMFLYFQRKILMLLIIIFLISIVLSLIKLIDVDTQLSFFKLILQIFVNKTTITNFTEIIQVISIILYTFIHCRFIMQIKRNASFIYFERFDKLSRKKDADWLRCRTLHISGLAPKERMTESLIFKLNMFLEKKNAGRVIDVNFIPNYRTLLNAEKQKTELEHYKNLVNENNINCFSKLLLPKYYLSNEELDKNINKIENEIDDIILQPVFSSGHAFICFDSLLSAYIINSYFKENSWKKLKLQITNIIDSLRNRNNHGPQLNDVDNSTFGKFQEEGLENVLQQFTDKKLNIVVDQQIEPFDVIWLNIGGNRGLYIIRRIVCNIMIILILLFVLWATSFIYSQQVLNFFKEKTYKQFGYLLITYIPPLVLIGLGHTIFFLIGFLSKFENHYSHSNYQYSYSFKILLYMLLTMFIIPAFAFSIESLKKIIKGELELQEFLSGAFISQSTCYFFITLIVQTGTVSSICLLLRVSELIANGFSPLIVFYKRHFINIENQRHRGENNSFGYGYHYAHMLVFYTISIVYSPSTPAIVLSGIYYFLVKHITDFICLLTIHGREMDSNGKLINRITKMSSISLIIFHICMIGLFLFRKKYTSFLVLLILFVITVIFIWRNTSDYAFDIYKLHNDLEIYDKNGTLESNALNEWRNLFRHPLTVPIAIGRPSKGDLLVEDENKDNMNISMNKNLISINRLSVNKKKAEESYLELSESRGYENSDNLIEP